VSDYTLPTYPMIRVVHLDSDIHPDEPGLVSVHDELTGTTTVQDAEKYLWKNSQ